MQILYVATSRTVIIQLSSREAFCAAVFICRITDLVRPSVCLYVCLVTARAPDSKSEGRRETEIVRANVRHGSSNRCANF